MQSPTNRSARLSVCAVLTALALIFSYIEFLIPLNLGIPGVKLGLANLVVIVALYSNGALAAFAINFVRILLSALLFGNMFSAIYALCGGILSMLFMMLLYKTKKFSVVGISMAGGVMHNIGQLIAAYFIMDQLSIFYYLPVLLLTGLAAGIVNGVLATLIIKKVKLSGISFRVKR